VSEPTDRERLKIPIFSILLVEIEIGIRTGGLDQSIPSAEGFLIKLDILT